MLISIQKWLYECPLPRLETRLLLQHVSGFTHGQIIIHAQDSLKEEWIIQLENLVVRRLLGEPIAYILGEKEFYGRIFAVNPAVLIPRPETEHVVDAVLERLPYGGRVWDLGTGSGVIAVTIALERADAKVIASDISVEALNVAQKNAQRLTAKVNFKQGSWFHVDPAEKFKSHNIVVSNPPYIEVNDTHLQEGDLRFEPQQALTDFADGLTCIRQLADGASKYLKKGGWLLVEHGYQQAKAVRALFQTKGYTEVETLTDLAGLDRVTLGRQTD